MKMTNKQLDLCIVSIADGNKTAIAQLYDEMKCPIYTFALSILKNQQSAEDAMQETFIKIILHADSYKKNTNPKAWIFKIARNCCMDILKKSDRDTPLETNLILNIPSAENLSEEVSDTAAVIQAINNLEEVERTIVTLYLVMDLKQTEIAELLQMPYRTVRSKYKHALKKLRRIFDEKEGD